MPGEELSPEDLAQLQAMSSGAGAGGHPDAWNALSPVSSGAGAGGHPDTWSAPPPLSQEAKERAAFRQIYNPAQDIPGVVDVPDVHITGDPNPGAPVMSRGPSSPAPAAPASAAAPQGAPVAGGGSAPAPAGGLTPQMQEALAKYADLHRGAAEERATGIESAHEGEKTIAEQLAQFDTGQRGMAEGNRMKRADRDKAAETEWRDALEASSRNKLVDPELKMGTGQHLAMALSLAMNAFGQGLNPNAKGAAAQIWAQRWDNDVAAQKQAIASGKVKADELHTAYADALRRTGDEEKSELLAQAQGRQAFVDGLKGELLTTQDPLKRADGLENLAQAEKDIVELQDKFDLAHKAAKEAAKGKGTGAGGAASIPGAVHLEEKNIFTLPNGTQMYSPREKDAALLQDMGQDFTALQAEAAQVRALRQQDGSNTPGTEAHAQLQAAVARMHMAYLGLGEKVRPGKVTLEHAKEVLGDPSSLYRPGIDDSKMEAGLHAIAAEYHGRIAGSGARQVSELGYAPKGKGGYESGPVGTLGPPARAGAPAAPAPPPRPASFQGAGQ